MQSESPTFSRIIEYACEEERENALFQHGLDQPDAEEIEEASLHDAQHHLPFDLELLQLLAREMGMYDDLGPAMFQDEEDLDDFLMDKWHMTYLEDFISPLRQNLIAVTHGRFDGLRRVVVSAHPQEGLRFQRIEAIDIRPNQAGVVSLFNEIQETWNPPTS